MDTKLKSADPRPEKLTQLHAMIPVSLRKKLEKKAARNRRKLREEVIIALDKHLKGEVLDATQG